MVIKLKVNFKNTKKVTKYGKGKRNVRGVHPISYLCINMVVLLFGAFQKRLYYIKAEFVCMIINFLLFSLTIFVL